MSILFKMGPSAPFFLKENVPAIVDPNILLLYLENRKIFIVELLITSLLKLAFWYDHHCKEEILLSCESQHTIPISGNLYQTFEELG